MELSGHSGEVFCAKFDPNGNYIASGSMDRSISEWKYLRGSALERITSDLLQCFGERLEVAKITEYYRAIKGQF